MTRIKTLLDESNLITIKRNGRTIATISVDMEADVTDKILGALDAVVYNGAGFRLQGGDLTITEGAAQMFSVAGVANWGRPVDKYILEPVHSKTQKQRPAYRFIFRYG